ncbi:hypothetical protein HN587_06960 [Candidatus Woesearchaeota archaeon]|jgi:hypothetical protein|nr:hypothetical protein [Candidatus Woesearchaeota archaeon]
MALFNWKKNRIDPADPLADEKRFARFMGLDPSAVEPRNVLKYADLAHCERKTIDTALEFWEDLTPERKSDLSANIVNLGDYDLSLELAKKGTPLNKSQLFDALQNAITRERKTTSDEPLFENYETGDVARIALRLFGELPIYEHLTTIHQTTLAIDDQIDKADVARLIYQDLSSGMYELGEDAFGPAMLRIFGEAATANPQFMSQEDSSKLAAGFVLQTQINQQKHLALDLYKRIITDELELARQQMPEYLSELEIKDLADKTYARAVTEIEDLVKTPHPLSPLILQQIVSDLATKTEYRPEPKPIEKIIEETAQTILEPLGKQISQLVTQSNSYDQLRDIISETFADQIMLSNSLGDAIVRGEQLSTVIQRVLSNDINLSEGLYRLDLNIDPTEFKVADGASQLQIDQARQKYVEAKYYTEGIKFAQAIWMGAISDAGLFEWFYKPVEGQNDPEDGNDNSNTLIEPEYTALGEFILRRDAIETTAKQTQSLLASLDPLKIGGQTNLVYTVNPDGSSGFVQELINRPDKISIQPGVYIADYDASDSRLVLLLKDAQQKAQDEILAKAGRKIKTSNQAKKYLADHENELTELASAKFVEETQSFLHAESKQLALNLILLPNLSSDEQKKYIEDGTNLTTEGERVYGSVLRQCASQIVGQTSIATDEEGNYLLKITIDDKLKAEVDIYEKPLATETNLGEQAYQIPFQTNKTPDQFSIIKTMSDYRDLISEAIVLRRIIDPTLNSAERAEYLTVNAQGLPSLTPAGREIYGSTTQKYQSIMFHLLTDQTITPQGDFEIGLTLSPTGIKSGKINQTKR